MLFLHAYAQLVHFIQWPVMSDPVATSAHDWHGSIHLYIQQPPSLTSDSIYMAYRMFEFVVHGTVQGVGFREFVRTMARADGIVGWVKNHSNGTVVGLAQGEEASLGKFKQNLATGPRHATVEDVKFSNENEVSRLQFQSFDISH